MHFAASCGFFGANSTPLRYNAIRHITPLSSWRGVGGEAYLSHLHTQHVPRNMHVTTNPCCIMLPKRSTIQGGLAANGKHQHAFNTSEHMLAALYARAYTRSFFMYHVQVHRPLRVHRGNMCCPIKLKKALIRQHHDLPIHAKRDVAIKTKDEARKAREV